MYKKSETFLEYSDWTHHNSYQMQPERNQFATTTKLGEREQTNYTGTEYKLIRYVQNTQMS